VNRLIFILCFPFLIKGQGIIVGDSISTGIIYKNIKDSTIKMYPKSLQWSDFDYDGDNNMDIRFKVNQNFSPGHTQEQLMAETLNNNIDFISIPTSTAYLDTAGLGSIVDNTSPWFSSSTSHYLFTFLYAGGNYYNYGVYKASGSYMAFRHITNTDTIFGWFLLNSVYPTGITVRSWAYKKKCSSFPNVAVNSTSNVICSGSTVTLTAMGSNSYTWSTGSNQNFIVVTLANTTSYTVEGNSYGCLSNAIITQSVNSCIGIEEYKPLQVRISPNPSHSFIKIESNRNDFENAKIEIINQLGQIVLQPEFIEQIDVSSLTEGCYFIKLSAAEKVYYSKFVKE
jgi:hypothetical protein